MLSQGAVSKVLVNMLPTSEVRGRKRPNSALDWNQRQDEEEVEEEDKEVVKVEK